MSLDASQLASQVLAAMRNVLATEWPSIATLAVSSSENLAGTLVEIEQLIAGNKIDADVAQIMLDSQRDAASAVLLSVEGMTDIAVARAINAGLAVVAQAVNAAVKFPLL